MRKSFLKRFSERSWFFRKDADKTSESNNDILYCQYLNGSLIGQANYLYFAVPFGIALILAYMQTSLYAGGKIEIVMITYVVLNLFTNAIFMFLAWKIENRAIKFFMKQIKDWKAESPQ